MKQFFTDFDSLNAFTLSLGCNQDKLECRHCYRHDQFVSHGITYKQVSSRVRVKVGKRLFCSNRYGRRGCGRTFQLYLASEIPSLRYNATHLFVFVMALLANHCVDKAYRLATKQTETRNAWRWLNRLMLKLSDYRIFLRCRAHPPNVFSRLNSSKLKHLLPTLSRLFFLKHNGCVSYQVQRQISFL